MTENGRTLQSYELGIEAYVEKTVSEVSGIVKTWMNATLRLLSSDARIIEVGSGFGRDARYIESQGFRVERSDAAEGFVTLLQKQGYSARKFNIVTDPFPASYDLIFANAVFLHLTPQELQQVLSKIHRSLVVNGILAFSVKIGEGEEWTSEKVGHPRYFCYWQEDKIQALLREKGFELLSVVKNEKFMCLTARRKDRAFALHPKLEKKVEICDLPLCRVLLENEQHYPWLLLVPRQPDLARIMDLSPSDQLQLIKELDAVQKVMWEEFQPTQLNVAAIGNKTPQLHVHVIARFSHDPAWPNTVWDHPVRAPYEESLKQARTQRLRALLLDLEISMRNTH